MPPNQPPLLNLRSLKISFGSDLQDQIDTKLDSFLLPFLQKKTTTKVHIVVGKGINSKRLIDKKNPVRYYTEIYLQKLGLTWQEADYFSGQNGVLVVFV